MVGTVVSDELVTLGDQVPLPASAGKTCSGSPDCGCHPAARGLCAGSEPPCSEGASVQTALSWLALAGGLYQFAPADPTRLLGSP